MAPEQRVLDNHAVIIADGRILDCLPVDDARERYQPNVVIERPGHVVMPGLINTHTHAAMTLFRGLADDLPLEAWLRDGIWPAERQWVSAEMVRDGTELAILEMLRGGITCFSDQYFYPEIVAETADDLHMRAVVGTPVVDFETSWAADAAECLGKGAELVHDAYADHPLISSCFAPHSMSSLADASFRELRVMADQLDKRIQIHLGESAAEVQHAIETTGKRPFERLSELGLVNASLLIVHGVHLDQQEQAAIAEAGVGLAHCPKSNLKLASGIAPVADFRTAGINVGIGTDGAASNNTLDMLDEMRTAALLAKVQSKNAAALKPADVLRMGTLDAARCLGLDAEVGSIEAGKWADLITVDLGTVNSQPVYDPVSQLVYTARAEQVRDVWVAGRQHLENGALRGMNLNNLATRIGEWQQRIGGAQAPA